MSDATRFASLEEATVAVRAHKGWFVTLGLILLILGGTARRPALRARS
jgi:hypothetical protein